MNRSPFSKQEIDGYRYPQKRTTERQLQGEQFLRGLDGKLIDPRITEILYDNPFALEETTAGRLTIEGGSDE